MTASTRSVATLLRDHARWIAQVNDQLARWGFDGVADAIEFVRGEEEATALQHMADLKHELKAANESGWRAPQRNATEVAGSRTAA